MTIKQPEIDTTALLVGEEPGLSPHWASYTRGCKEAQELFTGRVEHLVSGQATRFDSLETMAAFMKQVITEVEGERPT